MHGLERKNVSQMSSQSQSSSNKYPLDMGVVIIVDTYVGFDPSLGLFLKCGNENGYSSTLPKPY